jgi:glycerol-3-phosphate dehydrogenase
MLLKSSIQRSDIHPDERVQKDKKSVKPGEGHDLLVIGGGINGSAIANFAQRIGLRTILLERSDLAGGTSSRSSKLIHGGIRYLEQFRFGLVREALHERWNLLQEAPHLVWPLRIVAPLYQGGYRAPWMMRLGVTLYDLLAGSKRIDRHEVVGKSKMSEAYPHLLKKGMMGGLRFFDAQMDDARLCLENALAAQEAGACIRSYVEVSEFVKREGRVVGVRVVDRLNSGVGEEVIYANHIVCCAGPWTNQIRKLEDPKSQDLVRTTKGVHLIFPWRLAEDAFLLPTKPDKRIFFVLPWRGHQTIVGTTDTDYSGDPGQVATEPGDVEYLMRHFTHFFPSLKMRALETQTTFSGLRPLVRHGGSASQVSREHDVFTSNSSVTYVVGGKYTTYRVIAKECLKRVVGQSIPDGYFIYGAGDIEQPVEILRRMFRVEIPVIHFLKRQYGKRAVDVMSLLLKRPELGLNVCPHLPYMKAQLVYAQQNEMAKTFDDIVSRRLWVSHEECFGSSCREAWMKTAEELCPSLRF